MYLLSAAWGTYVIILDVIIISEQKVIIFILRLFSQLWCVIVKEKLYSAANI
jgi:hypothetical protein